MRRRARRAATIRCGRAYVPSTASTSSYASRGARTRSRPSARSRLPRKSRTSWKGSATSEQLASSVYSAAERAARRWLAVVSGVRRTPRCAASTWKRTASGTTRVRCPARAARQPKSRSLPNIGSRLSKPPRAIEDAAAHQHPRGSHREHVAGAVVLTLVVLAALQAGLPAAGAAHRDADLEQPTQRGPLAQLRAEDVGGGVGGRGGEELLEGVGGGPAVVVQQPQPLVVGAGRGEGVEPGEDRRTEGRALREAQHRLEAEAPGQDVVRGVDAARVDREHAVGPHRLGLQTVEHSGQPASTVVADQESSYRHGAPP